MEIVITTCEDEMTPSVLILMITLVVEIALFNCYLNRLTREVR